MAPDTSQREQIWHIGSLRLDVWVQSERSSDEMKLKRPWLTIAVDDHGCIRNMYFSFEAPDSRTVGNLVSSICTLVNDEGTAHRPIELWVDNGKALQGTIGEHASNSQLVGPMPSRQLRHDKVAQIFRQINESPLPDLLTLENLRIVLDSFSDRYNADLELTNGDEQVCDAGQQ